MDEELHFRKFLKLCQSNGITVWADPNLKRDKQTTGHWNGDDHISVFRPSAKAFFVSPTCSDKRITTFIEQSPDIKWEMAVLLHEYGHWFHKHLHQSTVDSGTAYKHELEAWAKGEEIARSLGVQDFSVFHADKAACLKGYQEGLRSGG